VDVSILKEIARIVQSRAKVPDRIQLQKRAFLITYLDDHRQRIEEALRRHDSDRLNMLFGQLESKVKYQVVRRAGAAALKQRASRSSQPAQHPKAATPAKSAKTSQKKQTARHGGSPPSKRPATVTKKSSKSAKPSPRKPTPKRQNARKRGR
jgi:hypothetical protein